MNRQREEGRKTKEGQRQTGREMYGKERMEERRKQRYDATSGSAGKR